MGSNLPDPPEEYKLKDDYVVDVPVSYVALTFNDRPFLTTSICLVIVLDIDSFFFLKYYSTGLNTIHLLRLLLL